MAGNLGESTNLGSTAFYSRDWGRIKIVSKETRDSGRGVDPVLKVGGRGTNLYIPICMYIVYIYIIICHNIYIYIYIYRL